MRILIYGDSNSWGYLDDGTGERHARRWPVVMAECLQARDLQVDLVEECLPGRTTDLDDPLEGSHFNGSRHLVPILLSHQPLDHVIVKLGTNDMKLRMARGVPDIAAAAAGLARLAGSTPAGHGGWQATSCPGVTLICPAPIGNRAEDAAWERHGEWIGARDKSLSLGGALARECAKNGIDCLDAGEAARSSEIDPIHWTRGTHEAFGAWMAEQLSARLQAG